LQKKSLGFRRKTKEAANSEVGGGSKKLNTPQVPKWPGMRKKGKHENWAWLEVIVYEEPCGGDRGHPKEKSRGDRKVPYSIVDRMPRCRKKSRGTKKGIGNKPCRGKFFTVGRG